MKIKKLLAILISLITLISFGATFTACGSEKDLYEVTFNADGGTLTFEKQRLGIGERIKFPEVAKEGYTLNCWVYVVGDQLNIINEDDEYMLRSSVTFKAIWMPNGAYAIKYDLDGGSMSVDNPFYYTEDSEAVNLIEPTKQGYSFVGWSGTGIDGVSSSVSIKSGNTGNKEFKANYYTTEYNVTLVLSSVAFNPISQKQENVQCTYNGLNEFRIEDVKYGTSISLEKPALLTDEFYFDCWYYIKDGKEVEFVNAGEQGATVFNMYNFSSKDVKIYVKCLSGWTKDY